MIRQLQIVTGLTDGYDPTVAHFGETLRRIVEDKLHLDQRSFSAKAAITTQTLASAYRAETPKGIRHQSFKKIARGLDMTVQELDAAWKQPAAPPPLPADPTIPAMVHAQLADMLRPYGVSVGDWLAGLVAWLNSEGDLTRGLVLQRAMYHVQVLAGTRRQERPLGESPPPGAEWSVQIGPEVPPPAAAGKPAPKPSAAGRGSSPPKG